MSKDTTWIKPFSLEWLQSFEVYKFRRRLIDSNIKVKEGMKVLEAGSGPAHDSIIFAEKGAEVHALDHSREGLEAGKKFYSQLGFPLKTKLADLKDIPYPDNYFDVVWSESDPKHVLQLL